MRLTLCLYVFFLISTDAYASFQSSEELAAWMAYYYKSPEPNKIPEVYEKLCELGLPAKISDKAPLFGFLAGVLKNNPDRAASWIERLSDLPIRQKEILILGIWYSELPNCRKIVYSLLEKDNAIKKLFKSLPNGSTIPITEIPLEQGTWVLDALWGNYMATGSSQPVVRIITALALYDKKYDKDRFMVGAAAKWSLISNAKQHKRVFDVCKEEIENQPHKIANELKNIIKELGKK